MPRLTWDAPGERFFEAQVDHGVLFVADKAGVPWNGLISVNQTSVGGEPRPFYIDGVKYYNEAAREELQGAIQAFTYPEEFEACDGLEYSDSGVGYTNQRRIPFNLSYRTKVGNDLDGLNHGYKIHLVYNAMVAPTARDYGTAADTPEAMAFNWPFTTTPVKVSGRLPTAHYIIDSRRVNAELLAEFEELLYGSSTLVARIPAPEELLGLFQFTVTDNGDGTFTVIGPESSVKLFETGTFEINWDGAKTVDLNTYTIQTTDGVVP